MALGSRGRCGTRPGTLLRKDIPVRTEHWDVAGPGWVEADTVAHCGNSMDGDFCWSLTVTDVHTQWTETRGIWNKGQHAVRERIADVEAKLAFPLLGFDSDNGGEFLNWHLRDYFLQRPKPVLFTRSRPYHKNDNARVEQKNWTHVRQLVGYGRFDDPAQAELLNSLYEKEWSQFRNFFCPAMKHLRTEVEGSRKKRIYDTPLTPFERLKACPCVDPKQIARLEKLKATLNPIKNPRRKRRGIAEEPISEQPQLRVFVDLFVTSRLVFHVISYRTFIPVFSYRARKISVGPKLPSPQLLFHLRTAPENLSCSQTFDQCHDFRHAVCRH